jgi:hypothetical protein
VGNAVQAFEAPSQDELGCPVWIGLDRIVPEADYRPALVFKKCGSAGVIIEGLRIPEAWSAPFPAPETVAAVDGAGLEGLP